MRPPRSAPATRLLLTAALGALLAGLVVMGEERARLTGTPVPLSDRNEAAGPTPEQAARSTSECGPVIARLSPRERLAQLLVVGVDPADPAAAADLVRAERVGGIFVGGDDPTLLTGDALAPVHHAATLPLSVAVDDEGGRVQRVDRLDGPLPSAREMARTMSPGQVRALAERRGAALRARGVTVDYAPVLDIGDQPDTAVIGDRAFSADPTVARDYALAFASGLAAAGVQPVLKHFPGHGHADGDSHRQAVVTPPLSRLRAHDLRAYADLADFGSAGVMVGHLTVPGLTAGEPASLSPAAYRLLRTEFGFPGAVVTDDLGAMRAVTDRYPLPDAVLAALRAGADQALWSSGGRVGPVLDRLERAVATGELPRSRVREALERVLLAKSACG
ncbi:beta-N-acetylhexosaminidase [Amycolatopsis arida]|uniref:beta-N-acetylhexosaminidase n=1 Tax=Amycolatopsis arida TaxID=587909 RepID=A0A1I5YIT0_9PSEU|nr:glycoside hydrolase family 3 N-terminal domain-containing protein [Amycolatopsis arida]TDX90528.1 beta-N-acetylhexosaminidase [Amycolatopsis arida]SFQ43807.1 beta-N-acetylhexosaminidase [Amycolatopsis arida]